jgi:hypothetical protein
MQHCKWYVDDQRIIRQGPSWKGKIRHIRGRRACGGVLEAKSNIFEFEGEMKACRTDTALVGAAARGSR